MGGVSGAAEGAAGGALVGGIGGALVGGIAYMVSHDVDDSDSGNGSKGGESGGGKQGAQDKALTKTEIKALEKGGQDAHTVKAETLGTNKNLSKFDLYKDQKGDIYVKPKGSSEQGEFTGLNIKDFIKKP